MSKKEHETTRLSFLERKMISMMRKQPYSSLKFGSKLMGFCLLKYDADNLMAKETQKMDTKSFKQKTLREEKLEELQ
ncbi:hypothetical protein LINPERPRIM_LOCUS43629 [Linum perenne]